MCLWWSGANLNDGSRLIMDDFREAYSWFRDNTHPNARIMSWWDYGYQACFMANRTIIVDNNTWNNTHIATVGMVTSKHTYMPSYYPHTSLHTCKYQTSKGFCNKWGYCLSDFTTSWCWLRLCKSVYSFNECLCSSDLFYLAFLRRWYLVVLQDILEMISTSFCGW